MRTHSVTPETSPEAGATASVRGVSSEAADSGTLQPGSHASQPLLEVRGLEVGYLTKTGTVVAVHGVDLDLRRGQILGIAGESGSGKSTLAHALTRLIEPPGVVLNGSVRYHFPVRGEGNEGVAGPPIEILSLAPEELRALRWEELAIVFQSAMNALNPVLTVEAQILDAIAAHRPGTRSAQARERVREMLAMVGVPPERSRSFPHELSGGMRQRVAIAMALALEPDLVILDEPTTGLDVVVQRSILEHLVSLREELDFSVIFITHDLSLLLEMCDSILVMYAGRVIERSSTSALYRDPLHPYSEGLRDAFPPLTGPRRRLEGIPGSPPDPANPVSGCPFHPRCPYAFAPCPNVLPGLLPVDTRQVRCLLYDPQYREQAPVARAKAAIEPAPPDDSSSAGFAASSPSPTLLEGVHLTRLFRLQQGRRRTVHAVEDVSLSVEAGQISAIVGESGSGKSTLLRLLALLDTPTAGELRLEGTPIRHRRFRADSNYRDNVQLVFQDPYASMNPVRTIGYHLERPLRLHAPKLRAEERRERVRSLLERVSLTPAGRFIDRYPHELSGGQRQRTMIARALAVGPSVLLADEPVSMLDVSMQVDVLNLLRDLASNEQIGIVYVTHNIASARYLADTISVMYAGSIVESGPSERVTASPAHPYTQLLLASAPQPESASPSEEIPTARPSEARALDRGVGEPPDLADPPAACRFHPRCPHSMAICAEQAPPAFDVESGGWAACWLLKTAADGGPASGLSAAQRQPLRAHRGP